MVDQTINQLGEKFDKGLAGIPDDIKTNCTKYVSATQDVNIEDQNHVEGTSLTTPKTYAAALEVTANFRKIMDEAKEDEKVEEQEKERRCKNLIIHGADEKGVNNDEIKQKDKEYIARFLDKIGVSNQPESIIRLGKQNETNKRTMKIVIKTKEDKERVMVNLNKLKGAEEEFGRISVTEDLTIRERNLVKQWVKKADEKSTEDPNYVYKVCGDSKNGYRLMRFLRKKHRNNQAVHMIISLN